jgi:TfoX/Sxy family transcriptional regulator of competence genes
MASSKEYRDYIIEELNLLEDIIYKTMMGEYLLYYKGILFGGIYDDRFLVKITDSNKKYNMKESIPYNGAKSMYLVSDVDNKELLKDIIIDTYKDLNK